MPGFYTEADYENSIIELFQNMGYHYVFTVPMLTGISAVLFMRSNWMLRCIVSIQPCRRMRLQMPCSN